MLKRFLAIAAVLALIFMCSCTGGGGSESVGTVNGEDVTADELNYFKQRLRSSVISKFVSEGAEFGDGFWSSEIGGITPERYLEYAAFDECVKAKTLLIECREYGIYDDISFAALKAKAEKFNRDNKGRQTVGISSISLDIFYTYYIETGSLELKNVLAESGIAPDAAAYDEYLASLAANAQIVRSDG